MANNYSDKTLDYIDEHADEFDTNTEDPWLFIMDAIKTLVYDRDVKGTDDLDIVPQLYRFMVDELGFPDVIQEVLNAPLDTAKLKANRPNDYNYNTFKDWVKQGLNPDIIKQYLKQPLDHSGYFLWEILDYIGFDNLSSAGFDWLYGQYLI